MLKRSGHTEPALPAFWLRVLLQCYLFSVKDEIPDQVRNDKNNELRQTSRCN